MKQPFYMNHVENSPSPTFRFNDIKLAEAEAKRLARLTHRKVTVLQSVMEVELNEFKVSKFESEDLPF